MKKSYEGIAAGLLLLGTVQFLLSMIACEALYKGYSSSLNFISDLGVGNTSLLFNSSVMLFGACAAVSSYLLHKSSGERMFPIVLLIASIGAFGVGLFPGTTGTPHYVATLITFIFAALSAILSGRKERGIFGALFVALGTFSLVALAMFLSGKYAGIGQGGMERMIVYPVLAWAIAFSGILWEKSKK